MEKDAMSIGRYCRDDADGRANMSTRSTVTDFKALADREMKRFHIDRSRYTLRFVKSVEEITIVVFDGDPIDSVEPCVIVSFAPSATGWDTRLELRYLRRET
jgi:hypothetical protein